MTEVEVLRWVLTLVMGGLIWFFKKQIADYDVELNQLKKDLHDVRLQYVHEKELKEFKEEIKEMFHEIKEDIKELKK